ncbi:6-carboxytetrahydropterin synthase [uncultured Maricaulis sp.]|uniref:6-pyruvoyl trahydropterin synthase family protein n=1 Tax=uncultured Maricaulis sp. TaxID=174710 RepID=UPI0030DCA548
MAHLSTKSYGNERGLSCCSRQWAADSHCALLHGYSFGFNFVFAAEQLDKRGWVLDFGKGGFGPIKDWLHDMFDHTLLVAADDPQRPVLEALGEQGLARVRVVEGTSCERMAELAFHKASEIVTAATGGRCWVESVECSEHASNSAIYRSSAAVEQLAAAECLQAELARS